MHITRPVTEDWIWVGARDRRLHRFEGLYTVPEGMTYNSYLLRDEKKVLIDTVDQRCEGLFLQNVAAALQGDTLDYIVVQHMEPDHSATLAALAQRCPEAMILCSAQAANMIGQFFSPELKARVKTVKEGETLDCGRHTLQFIAAPMVHWPEVLMTYDRADKTLFSADAFGTFGAMDDALFTDELVWDSAALSEARRYYANIVGKYGPQVQNVLKKAAALTIDRFCPLHGTIWRRDLNRILGVYDLWSRYEPEQKAVTLVYGSVYGNTGLACDALAALLRQRGIRTRVFDLSAAENDAVLASIFENSHLVLCSATTNAGLFARTEELLRHMAAHNVQNRDVYLIENGTWAPAAAKPMRELFSGMKNMRVDEEALSLRSVLADTQLPALQAMAERIAASLG